MEPIIIDNISNYDIKLIDNKFNTQTINFKNKTNKKK